MRFHSASTQGPAGHIVVEDKQSLFKDIEIDRAVINSLPENGIPEELRYVIDESGPSVHVENEGPPQNPVANDDVNEEELVLENGSTSFFPMRQRQRKEGEAIQDAVNEGDPLDWPSTEGNAINEFKTDGLASMAFPTLFPYGKGDPTNRARNHDITLTGIQALDEICRVYKW